ncbi:MULTISPECIES: DUF3566 domain-containing protein [Cryobacterium]|jgi:hypothetical protein|uniref:DUF3566 domain-containing protein n=2 Tax=Cryobacterium TaxID=69578 RepID=A0ABY7NBW1_9MICO|nr:MULTISPECIES: DUF3566 domain-containing protein [Cryobacterium]MDY7529660.1 DUF3566 domain-containing protein [Cryobacterium sp. 10C2]MDY7542156.1 DUF3566 domain-containing protein [Cryobacterium sp. 5B3]MEB0000643.1 DUF3566 domain-containing protein [Cryobacterium sp. RTS3]MEB0001527.1 DUF3566 domain-containing protein [Cryobacterium sp. RTC2.1]MEB0202124.1 DUF3566 domain-containing protein [Cryobacterium sp. 5I3]
MSSVAEKLAKKSGRRPTVTTKQVRLKLVYIDFWSAVKLSFLIALCLGIVTIVATFLIFTVLNGTGIFGKIDALYADIAGSSSDLASILSIGNVMGFAVVVAVLNTVVITALGAVYAVLYNLSVKITGGLLVGFTNN